MSWWNRSKGKTTAAADSVEPPRAKILDSLTNVAAGLNTSRDKRAFSFYGSVRILTYIDLENAYRGSWLAGRIVEAPSEDMTRQWVELNWDGYDEDENSVRAIETEEARLGVREKFKEAIDWARLYGGALIMMILRGDTPESLALPIPKVIRKGDLQALRVMAGGLGNTEISPGTELDRDPLSPNFGYPLSYRITDTGAVVHWSRMIRFNGRRLPLRLRMFNGYWDDSELQHVIDSVIDYDATKGGIASMVFEGNVDILSIEGLAEKVVTRDGEQKIVNRLLAAMSFKSFNKTLVIDKEQEEYKQKTQQFAGLRDVLVEFMTDVCGASKIPMVKLFGKSTKGLNATGETDVQIYFDQIKSDQESKVRPQYQQLSNVLIPSTLGAMPKNFGFTFKSLWQTSDKERAEIEKLQAERDQINETIGAVSKTTIAREIYDVGTYRTMEAEDVDLIAQVEEDSEALRQKAIAQGVLPAVPAKQLPPAAGDPKAADPPVAA